MPKIVLNTKLYVEVKFVWDYSKPQEPRCPPPPRKQTSHHKPSHRPDWGGCRGVSTKTPPSSRRMRTRLTPQTPIPPLPKTLTRSSLKSTKSLSQSFPVDPGKLPLRLSRRHRWPLPNRRERLVDLHLEISLYKMKLGCDIRLLERMAGILTVYKLASTATPTCAFISRVTYDNRNVLLCAILPTLGYSFTLVLEPCIFILILSVLLKIS